jgi:hypothetical protein
MDGETQLRTLERKEQAIGLEGGTFHEKDRKKLLRAREIEKNASIFAEERSDPIFEAAYQRSVDRGGLGGEPYDSDARGKEERENLLSGIDQGSNRRASSDSSAPSDVATTPSRRVESAMQGLNDLEDSHSLAEEEAMITEQLAIEQETTSINNQIDVVHQEGKAYGKPSRFKYFVLFLLASIVDLLNLLTLTGFGYAISVIVSVVITIIMYLLFWFTNGKQKRANEYQQKIVAFTQELQKNIAHLERRTVQITRLAGKFSNNKIIKKLKPVKALRKGAAKILKVTRRNPMTKFLGSAIANMIPILDLFPWQIIGVYLSYRDERETYADASNVADDLLAEAPAEV